jgi:hypothetical protein
MRVGTIPVEGYLSGSIVVSTMRERTWLNCSKGDKGMIRVCFLVLLVGNGCPGCPLFQVCASLATVFEPEPKAFQVGLRFTGKARPIQNLAGMNSTRDSFDCKFWLLVSKGNRSTRDYENASRTFQLKIGNQGRG